ncbi:MAG: hypothetical protein Q9183_006389, partial [Haloplaca sp. 2 TL-2023]
GKATRFEYEQARAWVLQLRRVLRGPKEQRTKELHRRTLSEARCYQRGGILKLLGERINIPATSLVHGRDKLCGNTITNKWPKSKEKGNVRRFILVRETKRDNGLDDKAEDDDVWFLQALWDEDTDDEDMPRRQPTASAAPQLARSKKANNHGALLTSKDQQVEEEEISKFIYDTSATEEGPLTSSTDSNDQFADSGDHSKFLRKALKLLERYSEALDLDEDIETRARLAINRLHPNIENQTTRAQVAMCIITATPLQLRGEEGPMLMVQVMKIPKREFLPAMRSSWWAEAHNLECFRQQVLESAETSSGSPKDTMTNLFGC